MGRAREKFVLCRIEMNTRERKFEGLIAPRLAITGIRVIAEGHAGDHPIAKPVQLDLMRQRIAIGKRVCAIRANDFNALSIRIRDC